jgi:hypothetical protein
MSKGPIFSSLDNKDFWDNATLTGACCNLNGSFVFGGAGVDPVHTPDGSPIYERKNEQGVIIAYISYNPYLSKWEMSSADSSGTLVVRYTSLGDYKGPPRLGWNSPGDDGSPNYGIELVLS